MQLAYAQYIKQIIKFMCSGVLGPIYQIKYQSNIIRIGSYAHKCWSKFAIWHCGGNNMWFSQNWDLDDYFHNVIVLQRVNIDTLKDCHFIITSYSLPVN